MFVIFAKTSYMNTEIELIVKFSCEYFGIKEGKIYSHNTSDDCSICRYILWYYLHYEKNMTTKEIANEFFRTKVTVFKGIARIKNCMKMQRYYRDLYKNFVTEYEKTLC